MADGRSDAARVDVVATSAALAENRPGVVWNREPELNENIQWESQS
jgi:hypothetical protein